MRLKFPFVRKYFFRILFPGLTCWLIQFGCTQFTISDTLIPDETKRVSADYPLYDGMGVEFKADVDSEYILGMPSSLSGRKKYNYKELDGKTGTVVVEFALKYFIIILEDKSLVKVPSRDFLKTTYFTDNGQR